MGRDGLTNPTLAGSPKAEQIPQQATNDKTPGAATAPGNNKRENFSNSRDSAPPTASTSGGTKDVDGIGRGDTAYTVSRDTTYDVMMMSSSESNRRENNSPTARNIVGDKIVGSLGIDLADAVMLASFSEHIESKETDGSTIDGTNSNKDGGTVKKRLAESLLGDMTPAEDDSTSRPSFKSLTWDRPHVRTKVFPFRGEACCEWLAWVCHTIVEWLLTQWWIRVALAWARSSGNVCYSILMETLATLLSGFLAFHIVMVVRITGRIHQEDYCDSNSIISVTRRRPQTTRQSPE